MALIWSKKSTGLPIEIRSAHQRKKNQMPSKVSYCKLDIDIFKNEPNILIHTKKDNTEQWTGGSEITLTIGGNWTTYKSRIIQYFQQLAIITPYAQFGLTFFKQHGLDITGSTTNTIINPTNPTTMCKQLEFSIRYDRRSDQMPPLAKQVHHHPSALNDLLLKQLIFQSKQETLISFMCHDLSSIDEELALRLLKEIGKENLLSPHTKIKSLSTKQIHQLVRFFKQIHFKAPDGKWLSPAGEYNLRLGIMKELEPELIATHTEKPAVFEGHSFIVEAAVSIGCKTTKGTTNKVLKEGLNIYRFANRIPLLFEAGGDVVTRTAAKQIK
jgi:DNA topoisomerase VI subunit B